MKPCERQTVVVPGEYNRQGEVLVPKRHSAIAQRLSVGFDKAKTPSPAGTADNAKLNRPFGTNRLCHTKPNVETLGYSHKSLRDNGLRSACCPFFLWPHFTTLEFLNGIGPKRRRRFALPPHSIFLHAYALACSRQTRFLLDARRRDSCSEGSGEK